MAFRPRTTGAIVSELTVGESPNPVNHKSHKKHAVTTRIDAHIYLRRGRLYKLDPRFYGP